MYGSCIILLVFKEKVMLFTLQLSTFQSIKPYIILLFFEKF